MLDDDRSEHCNRALLAWENLCGLLTDTYKDHDVLRLRIPHSFVRKDQSLNYIRTRCMDALCLDASVRNFPLSHPVIWIDADTPYIGRRALGRLIAPLRKKEAYFAHANLLLVYYVTR